MDYVGNRTGNTICRPLFNARVFQANLPFGRDSVAECCIKRALAVYCRVECVELMLTLWLLEIDRQFERHEFTNADNNRDFLLSRENFFYEDELQK